MDNVDSIDLIIKTLKSWFGVDKGVDLMKIFNDFVNTERKPGQDIHSYVAEFEGRYNQLEKLGEKLSPRLLALFLLKNARLSDTEFQIITSNLNFSAEKEEEVKKLFEETKDALNKHQNCRAINSSSNQSQSDKTFFLDTNSLDSLTDEQQKDLVLWLKKKQKLPEKPEQTEEPPAKKWKKCRHCLCECKPVWKRCECPCSHHWHWQCPDKPKRDEKKEASSTACVSASGSSLNTLGGYLNGEAKKISSAKAQSRTKGRDVVMINHQLTFLANNKKNHGLSSDTVGKKHQLTVDSACPTSLVGAKYFRSIYQSYPESIYSQFQAEESNKTFQFGGGETTRSLGKYTFPVMFMDETNELHYLFLAMEIVEQDIIMLLGANSLTKVGALLDCGGLTLTLPEMFGSDVKFPMNYSSSGHLTLNFYNLTKEDGREAAQIFLTDEAWNKEAASKLLNYVHCNEPQFREVVNKVYLTKRGGRVKERAELTQKDLNKLHHLFGHAHPDKLETLIKTAGRWTDNMRKKLDLLLKCEVCKIEGRRVPKPNVSLPRANKHNHVVSVDLKENTRYSQSQPYILYLVDCFSRFKQAVFIPDKKAATVTEAILTNWVKLFGPMVYLHCDRGREWLNDCLQSFCFKFDIRLTSTAALTPNANAICERGHAVCDRMMDKMLTADPELTPEMALQWCVQACNTLELREGISPHMIVFGHNPVQPTLMDFKPGNEENTPELAKSVSDHIRAMLKAREEFCALESDRVLRQALKQRLYTKCDNVKAGDWIYFRQNNSTVWKGPVKVTSRDGKRIFVLNGARLNTINLDDILLCKSDEEMWLQSEEEFLTAPKPATVQIEVEQRESRENSSGKEITSGNNVQELETFSFSTAPAQEAPVTTDASEEEDITEVNATAPEEDTVQQQISRPYPNQQQPFRVSCNACHKNLSSRSIQVHASKKHGLRGSVSTLSTPVEVEPVLNNEETEEQVFFTAENQEQEQEEVYLTVIPRSRHNEPASVAAKEKELLDFDTFDVWDVVPRPKNANLIATQWVLVDKENEQGEIKRKARLCMRGDREKNKHLIPTDSPTVNKVTLKIMLTVAASQGWDIQCSDVTRAFLQTEEITRDVYVIPPPEAGVPSNKCCKLKRAAYGLLDACRGFYLNHSNKLKKYGFEVLKMDPAAFILKKDGNLEACNASHVDDSATMSDKKTCENVQNFMSKHFKYGESKGLPCRYLGNNISKVDGDIRMNQDHYVDTLEVPDISEVSNVKRDEILPDKFQSVFRSLASKLNMLAMNSRPDIMFDAKLLTTKYGSATKRDLIKAIKTIKRVKEESTELTLPDIGDIDDWILVGVTDASNKSLNNVFSVGGYVIMLVNKKTSRASVLTWSSKKIDRVCNSSFAAETMSLGKMAGNMFFVREILKQMFGEKAEKIPGLALTDNQDLYSCVHNLKPCEDKRLLADIIGIKEAIAVDKTITELRYISKDDMISDCLTKTGKLGDDLLRVVRTGVYNIPGGVTIRDSTRINVGTWQQLMDAENDF